MTLVRRMPLDELMALPRSVERMFEDPFFRPARWLYREAELPAVDVRTTPEAVIVEAGLPGLKAEDVEVSVDGDMLTITGSFKKEEEKEEPGYFIRELQRGTFKRVLTLPVPVKTEGAEAHFKDGLLTLTLPKAIEAQPHRIEVTGA